MPPLDLVTQLLIDGVWTNYASYSADGWSAQIGPDVETGTRPNKVTYVLADPDLSMDPTNPMSPLYGRIGLNTTTRLRINGATVSWAEASSWQPDATIEHDPQTGRGRAWVDVTAEGLLRRLSRWEEPLQSPMRRQIASYAGLIGYHPLEDPSGAAALAQVVPGAPPGRVLRSVTLAGDDGAGGSAPSARMGSDGLIELRYAASAASGYQLCWVVRLDAVPASGTMLPLASWQDSRGRTWSWRVNNTNFEMLVTDTDGATLETFSVSNGGINLTQWIRFRIKVTASGSTITYEPAWYLQDGGTIYGVTDTFTHAGGTGQPRSWFATGNAHTENAGYGHVFVTTDLTIDLVGGYDGLRAFNGYKDERAGKRFLRLMGEQGLTAYVVGDADRTVPMGRQKPGTIVDLVTECGVTDGGLVHDEPVNIALTMRTRLAMTNQDPVLTLDKSDLVLPLRKVIDDVGVVNRVTVVNADGSEATAERATGPLSIQPPPAGVGVYKGTVDVNQADTAGLADRAAWELAKGTVDRPRYVALTVDLLARPSFTAAVTGIRPGQWIALTGVEPDTVYLRMISLDRRGGHDRDTVVFNCLPAEVFQVAVIDDAGSRIGSSSTTLGAGATSSATSLTFSTANPVEVWSTTAVPYDVMVAGERITVTAMAAPSGTGPYTQTATVTRSANGVVKAQAAGAPITLAGARRIGL